MIAPIYQSVKYEFESIDAPCACCAASAGLLLHARQQPHHAPARAHARRNCRVATIASATASGVNAIAQTLIALTKSGDHILCFIETYWPDAQHHPPHARAVRVENTHAVHRGYGRHREGAGRAADAARVLRKPHESGHEDRGHRAARGLAHRHEALAVMDNTFAGFHQHGEYDIDVFVHSLTKYASGTGDVMGGAVIARREIIEGMRPDFAVLGALLDPHAAFLIQRGLKTYFVRYREQTGAAHADRGAARGAAGRDPGALPGPRLRIRRPRWRASR